MTKQALLTKKKFALLEHQRQFAEFLSIFAAQANSLDLKLCQIIERGDTVGTFSMQIMQTAERFAKFEVEGNQIIRDINLLDLVD